MSSHKDCISRRSLLGRGLAIASAAAIPAAMVSRPAFAISRDALHYTDASSTAGSQCANCMSFIPGTAPGAMGGCFILKGEINPKGHCDGWSAKGK